MRLKTGPAAMPGPFFFAAITIIKKVEFRVPYHAAAAPASLGATNTNRVDSMRLLAVTLLLAAAATTQACAQGAAPAAPAALAAAAPAEPKIYATAEEVQAMIAAAKNGTIVNVPGWRGGLEYRSAYTAPAIHPTDNEFFYIISGDIDLTTGGTLIEEDRSNAANWRGTGIKDGHVVKLHKGDFYIVPVGVPHSMTPVGGPAADLSIRLPAPK